MRSVNPAPCSVFQKRLPGRAKWCPTAPEYRPGLIPTNSTRSPAPMTSRMVFPYAAATSSRVGRAGSLRDLVVAPVLQGGEALQDVAADHPEQPHRQQDGEQSIRFRGAAARAEHEH